MKIMNFAVAVLLLASVTFAQSIKVPKEVTAAFNKLYPTVKTVEWKKEGKSNFEAKFKENGMSTAVVFEPNGKVMETEKEVSFSVLPKSAGDYIAAHFKGYQKVKAVEITNSAGTVTYEAKVQKGKDKQELLFDKSGKFLKKTA
ncbi:MAG: PepSY-like domain-containing protein [Ignavibacteriales bacterium]|jgi:Protein of unknown function (DUF2874).|nr:MAG: hypothetical protein F9K26_10755 [Ignavibacteriaceae bacterium]MBW7874077.1 PepSY-like domain-containing protein [Ignavibacteria bacterium]MCZ2143177.1 PepSY-like domain-containing protein [Ignavibacteriales bacterium]OQY74665.1 MAG: hypothetical protein B6D45_06540 [Ignavibacteriales bacterium UTCHB3]MBV6444058.1 hypothetical protein [Ignavibacteriaceae bacterium]